MFIIEPLTAKNLDAFVIFLSRLRKNHWSLTSSAFLRKTPESTHLTPQRVIQIIQHPLNIGVYLLKKECEIISSLQIDDKFGDGKVAVFSSVETRPDYQRRGIFWRSLGSPCTKMVCNMEVRILEAKTWPFNRKGIPLYKRVGFRAVPGTSLLMENYLPSIVKHPDTQAYFDRHDYIRTLQNERSYGYDAIEVSGLSVFEYCWKARKSDDTLRVLVDWQKKGIVEVECQVIESPSLAGEANHV